MAERPLLKSRSQRGAPAIDATMGQPAAVPPPAVAAKAQRSPAATRRPRRADADGSEPGDSRLFVTALQRGLDILSAFRIGDGPLGNQELAHRSGLTKPTVSRMTHTLTQLGYLTYDQRAEMYQLGGRTLCLGYAAISNLDIRRVAQPIMQELAERANANIALAIRDKHMILAVETAEGKSLVGLRMSPGARMPMVTTAGGKAYLATAPAAERDGIMEGVRRQFGDEWSSIQRSVRRAAQEMAAHSYCLSLGEWQKDINGAGAAVVLPNSRGVYALALGGPAYLVSGEQLRTEYGPALAQAARQIEAQLGAEQHAPALTGTAAGPGQNPEAKEARRLRP